MEHAGSLKREFERCQRDFSHSSSWINQCAARLNISFVTGTAHSLFMYIYIDTAVNSYNIYFWKFRLNCSLGEELLNKHLIELLTIAIKQQDNMCRSESMPQVLKSQMSLKTLNLYKLCSCSKQWNTYFTSTIANLERAYVFLHLITSFLMSFQHACYFFSLINNILASSSFTISFHQGKQLLGEGQ